MGATAPAMTDKNKTPLPKPLWLLLLVAALSALVVQFFIPAKSYFVFDSEPAFFAVAGVAIPFLLVVVSRIAGFILRQPPDYWHEQKRREKEDK